MSRWSGASAFDSGPKDNNPAKTDTFFGEGDFTNPHGHVVESQTAAGQTQYHYARDNEQNVYIDDNPNSSTYTGHQTEPPAGRN